MALSQNTLQRRKSIRAAHENSIVFRAGNIRMLANGRKIVAPGVANKPPQPGDKVYHKAVDSRPDQVRQMNEGQRSAGSAQESQQIHDGEADSGAVEQSAETAVDSPFSQMSITEQERERQPPQQHPPAANMMHSRLSTVEPGEIRELSPGARRRGKLPMRDSPTPSIRWPSVPPFAGIDHQLLRSDVVPESPLFCTPNDTPGSSALSPESMAVQEHVQRLEARRDAEDGQYEPSQAGTPWYGPTPGAQEELARDAEMLMDERRRRKSASLFREEAEVPGPDILSAPAAEDVRMEDDSAAKVQRQHQSSRPPGPSEDQPGSASKRRSPELHDDTPMKRQKRREMQEGLLRSWPYESLKKEKSKVERDGWLATIGHLWGVPCHEALRRTLWLHDSKDHERQPRDWGKSTLLPLRELAVLTSKQPQRAVQALSQAISERTQTSPMTPPRIWVETDLSRAIEIARSWSEPRSQTIGRTQAVEVVEETLPEVLRRTAEPSRHSIYQSSPEPAEQELDALQPTVKPSRGSFWESSPEPAAAEDTDDSVTIAKVDSASVSPTMSAAPIKVESSAPVPVTTPSSRLLQEPKSREEVMQMATEEFWDFYHEAEKRFDDANDEKRRRITPNSSKPGELSTLRRDQLKRYYQVAKADWRLAEEEWEKRAEQQSQQNAIVID